MDNINAAVSCLCLFLLPTFMLQTVGFFTPAWISDADCSLQGLFYDCCDEILVCHSYESDKELDNSVLAMQATSLAVMLLTNIAMFCELRMSRSHTGDNGRCFFRLFKFGLIFYPVAGLLSVVGCGMMMIKYDQSDSGYSLYLCLISGCIVLVTTFCVICLICCTAIRRDKEESRRILVEDGGVRTLKTRCSIAVGEEAVDIQHADDNGTVSRGVLTYVKEMNGKLNTLPFKC